MHVLRRIVGGLVVTVACVLASPAVEAAELVLRYVTDEGSPVRGEMITLARTDRDLAWLKRARGRELRVSLDNDGRAVIPDVPVGVYFTDLVSPRDPTLLRFRSNPLAPTPRITVEDPEERLELELTVSHGVVVRVDLDLPAGDPTTGFGLSLRHVETGESFTLGFPKDAAFIERTLPREAWMMTVTPAEGHLLTGVEVDGESMPDGAPIVDLRDGGRVRNVVFHFLEPARIEGAVSRVGGGSPAVMIRAELLDAGDWEAAARARDIDLPRVVEVSVDPVTARYSMALPHGRWLVRPVSSRLVRSDPPSVEHALAPREAANIDFTVELEEAAEGDTDLTVHVFGPDGARLPRSTEIYGEAEVAGAEGPPAWTGLGQRSALWIQGVAEGNYRVTAGTAETLEGVVMASAGGRQATFHRIDLEAGSGFRLLAINEQGERVAGLGVDVERLDDLPPLTLDQPAFFDAKQRRVLTSDLGGRAEATGFYAGRHRLAGAAGSPAFVELSVDDSEWRREIEVDLDGRESIEVQARFQPAARLGGRLACLDPPWILPARAAVRVFGAAAEPILDVADTVLGGPDRDLVEIGPVAAGTVKVAVRPAGFDRWSFVGGGADRTEAFGVLVSSAAVASSRLVDLPPVEVECGPAVDLLPEVADGQPFPPLKEVGVTVRVIDPATREAAETVPYLNPVDGRLEVRDLPAERWLLEITLDHPHFLPERLLTWEIPVELAAGSHQELVTEIEALGGAIAVRYPAGARSPSTVRAVCLDARMIPVEAALTAGKALLPSLPPGRWRLDTGGAEPTVIAPSVEVERGRTTVVRPLD